MATSSLPSDSITGLFGTSPSFPEFNSHLKAHHPPSHQAPESTKEFPDAVFHNYPSLGISYDFDVIKDKKSGATTHRLAAIHIYNEGVSRYKKFSLPLELPYGLSIDMKGKEVVEKLGEPSGKSQYPKCCIVYGDKGVQVDLAAKNWEDPECAIECLTFYQDFDTK